MPFEFHKDLEAGDGGEVAIFESFLRERGLKLTTARRELLNIVFSNHNHFTADELFDRCREADVQISKATLYRSLTILMDCKLLTAHDFGEGSKYYEHIYGHRHHDHLFCLACKSIVEFRSERIERLQHEAADELQFTMVRHSLSIFGVCEACRGTARGAELLAEARREAEQQDMPSA